MPNSKKILVVDDEQGFRDLFTYMLEPMGFGVTCVANGKEGVEKIEQEAYDVVLMDVHMPVLTGPEALKLMQKIRPEQLIIILSSGSDMSRLFENEAEKMGVLACLYKPVELTDLHKALEKALGPLPETSPS